MAGYGVRKAVQEITRSVEADSGRVCADLGYQEQAGEDHDSTVGRRIVFAERWVSDKVSEAGSGGKEDERKGGRGMTKKFKQALLDMLLQVRVPGSNGTQDNPDYQRGYDAAMMEIARFANGWKPETKAK